VQLAVSQHPGNLRATADVAAAESRVELAKALLDQATDRQKNGFRTGIDPLRADVQYQNQQQGLIEERAAPITSPATAIRVCNFTAQDELARANDNQIVALYSYNQARAEYASSKEEKREWNQKLWIKSVSRSWRNRSLVSPKRECWVHGRKAHRESSSS
jgi:hypothetical protein